MAWKSLNAVSQYTGIQPEQLYQGMLQSGRLMQQGGGTPIEEQIVPENVLANQGYTGPTGYEAMQGRKKAETQRALEQQVQLEEVKGKYATEAAAAHGIGYGRGSVITTPTKLTEEQKLTAKQNTINRLDKEGIESTDPNYKKLYEKYNTEEQLNMLRSGSIGGGATPILEDMIQIVNPVTGKVEKLTNRKFIIGIVKARQPNMSDEEIEKKINETSPEDISTILSMYNFLTPKAR